MNVLQYRWILFFILMFFKSKVNSSVRKIYILRRNGDQLPKMQLDPRGPAKNRTRDQYIYRS